MYAVFPIAGFDDLGRTSAPAVPRLRTLRRDRVDVVVPTVSEAQLATAARMNAFVHAVARARDKQAFASLFQHYAPRVKTYLLRHGTDEVHAEELAQETMLTVWRKADQFDPLRASAGTWIFTIARNLRIDALRKIRHPEFDPQDPAFVPDTEPAPDDVLQADETRAKIQEALKRLPPEQAAVIRLSFFEDKPHGEIAAELAVPLGTVKSRLRLAMRRVRTLLGD